ncbi:autotransporter family porin [Moraxella cuniculi DSM 21768]|uniref:Autotransporter family porin n=1 Tax=Moraxella cuniculi DSM 21768 TaxID=1122245 RepID=A0A1N7G0I2_9GAMM|nr:hypothetical protein [Moraxella cuniculi]OOS07788.1 hypothetical protein B0189_01900 [Moraxella cuniculi]SIS06088.1 autotransporter family porin [Moraxella cuniculi DSM 21768]
MSYQDENGNELRDAQRLTVGQKNNSVGAPNVPTRSVNTVATYNSDNIIGGTWGTENVEVPNLSVGDNQYINARFVNASNEAKAEVNIEQDRNTLLMYAKRTTLAQAESGADIDWTSQNRINFGNANTYRASSADPSQPAAIGETTTVALTRQVPKYAGQVEFDGQTYNVTDAASLKVYNDALIARLQEPRLFPGEEQNGLQKAYDDAFDKALKFEYNIYTFQETIPNDDVAQKRGERWVMAASGEGSTVTVKNGAYLDVRSVPDTLNAASNKAKSGGAMLAEKYGTAIVEEGAKISGTFYQMVVRDQGSRGINNGVISTGYYSKDGHDTSGNSSNPTTSNYVEGMAVTVYDQGYFENNNIINVAGYTLNAPEKMNYGVKVGNDSKAVNFSTGVINVAVNNGIKTNTAGMIAEGELSIVTNDGEIYIGRTAQYEKGAATQETTPNLQTYGIWVKPIDSKDKPTINTTVTHNGTITVGTKAQNATAIAVTRTAAGSKITLHKDSQINLNGEAQNANGSPPLQNIGLLAQDSGDADILTAGKITVDGINTVAVKLDGKAKVDATETSNITINGGQDPKSGTRNYAVYAEGYSADRQASGTIDGEINLNGVGAIGVHARNYATLTVNQGSSPKFNQGTDQIGFYIFGENASITTNEAKMSVDTERSNLYRIADGAKFVANGLTKITTSGKDSIAVLGTGSNTTINADTLTFNLTGEGSNALRIEGGATGNIDNNATVNISGKGAVIGVVDGQGYDVNNNVDGGIKASTLNSSLDTTTNVEGVNAYIARNQGKLVFDAKTLALSGNNSTAFSTDNGGVVEVNGSTVNVNTNGTLVKATEGSTATPNTFTANNATLNATRLLDAQSGVTQFTANNSTLAGAFVKADNATSTVALNDSTWRVTADSAMTSLAVNNSTVRFSPCHRWQIQN